MINGNARAKGVNITYADLSRSAGAAACVIDGELLVILNVEGSQFRQHVLASIPDPVRHPQTGPAARSAPDRGRTWI